MNYKGIFIYCYIAFVIFAIAVANSIILPVMFCMFSFYFMYKMMSNMSEQEIHQVLGIVWIQKMFNNQIINDMTNE